MAGMEAGEAIWDPEGPGWGVIGEAVWGSLLGCISLSMGPSGCLEVFLGGLEALGWSMEGSFM